MTHSRIKYQPAELEGLVRDVLAAAGLEADKARVVARGLLEGDLMGAFTHGLALAPGYAEELENGEMTASGGPDVLRDFGAAALWDGRYLPGVWLTREAGLEASRRAAKYGVEVHFCSSVIPCSEGSSLLVWDRDVRGTSYTFNFVGAQPGRWRVWAIDVDESEGPRSEWRVDCQPAKA